MQQHKKNYIAILHAIKNSEPYTLLMLWLEMQMKLHSRKLFKYGTTSNAAVNVCGQKKKTKQNWLHVSCDRHHNSKIYTYI